MILNLTDTKSTLDWEAPCKSKQITHNRSGNNVYRKGRAISYLQ